MKKNTSFLLGLLFLFTTLPVSANSQKDYQDNVMNCINIFPNYFAPIMNKIGDSEGFNMEFINSDEWEQLSKQAIEEVDLVCDKAVSLSKEINGNKTLEQLLRDSKIDIKNFVKGLNTTDIDLTSKSSENIVDFAFSAVEIVNTLGFTSVGSVPVSESISNNMNIRYDEISEITWYHDKIEPNYDVNSIYLYIGKKESEPPWLRFRLQYGGDDWLFVKSFIIKTDDKTYTLNVNTTNCDRDNKGYRIWEWCDFPVTQQDVDMITDIIKSKKVLMRYEGKRYKEDREVTIFEKIALDDVLIAYKDLDGTLSYDY